MVKLFFFLTKKWSNCLKNWECRKYIYDLVYKHLYFKQIPKYLYLYSIEMV